MAPASAPDADPGRVWRLARRQHGVIAHRQLLESGYSAGAIRHRRATGRLHALHRGVYAVGTPDVPRQGRWMAAALACPGAALSHGSAAALWGLDREGEQIELSVPRPRAPRRPGLRIHRRTRLGPADVTRHDGIPVTTVPRTLLDLASRLGNRRLEAAVSAADRLDLIDPESLRVWVRGRAGDDGVAALRRLLERDCFVVTESELERRFLPIARRAGLPPPETRVRMHGFRLDFMWRDLGLVVETDGLRYHRTPAQQVRDRRRDQVLTVAGLTPLRFTYEQIARRPDEVVRTLRSVAGRLRSQGDHGAAA